MIEEPRVTQLNATPTAFIHLAIPREEMPNAMGPAIGEVMSALAAQGIEATGPVFAHHLAMHPDTFDFEVGVPVSAPVTPSGRVEAGERPVIRVIQTVYHGPYEGLPDAWGEFHEWIESRKLEWAPDIWECYLVHPDADPNPDHWRTELNRPLAA